jgi:spermidine/putrescine transport system substrate-binding protein
MFTVSKRHGVFLLFCLSLIFILAACSPATTPPPEATQPPVEATQPPAEVTQPPVETTVPATEPAMTEPAATEAPAPSGELTVLEWAGYEIPDMWADFGKAYPNVSVTFNFGASDPDIYGKVLAGSTEDIIHLYTPFLNFYVEEGLIQAIDVSKLKNWDKLPQGFKDSCTIDGKVYCVPWDWGFSSILYRTDNIPEGVDSWNALFDEKYTGHISMWDDGPSAVSVGTYLKGYDEENLTDEQLAEIKQMWIDQRDKNLFYWVDEPSLEEAITSGDVWAAYGWNGAFYRLLQAGIPVAYADPKEGRNSWIGQYVISSKAKNYDLALAFLDEKLGKENATHLLVDYAYGHAVPEYFDVVTDPLLIKALSLDDPGILDRTNFTVPITSAQRDRFVELWAEVKAAP